MLENLLLLASLIGFRLDRGRESEFQIACLQRILILTQRRDRRTASAH